MSAAIIVTGGIGDCTLGLGAVELLKRKGIESDVFVNSHQEIIDFIEKCTPYDAFPCPPRHNAFKDPENPLNLPPEFLDDLHKKYDTVYSCFPDSLGQAPFSFPWFKYIKNYQDFLQTKIIVGYSKDVSEGISKNTNNVFIHATSVTPEKNYPLTQLQQLILLFEKVGYNVILCRTSQWKGTLIPFFCQGKFHDLVDRPIEVVVSTMEHCDYFIGIDSGPAHIAYHLGLPRIVLQQHYNDPFHVVRYHENPLCDMPLSTPPEYIYNRTVLNLRDPLTYALPSTTAIPWNINSKQMLYKKYYD